jgi:hypothetical protein
MTTFAPRLAKCIAVASPIPELEPHIKQHLIISDKVENVLIWFKKLEFIQFIAK